MGVATILRIICKYIRCNSNSSCGGGEDSDSVKENHKKKIRKKNTHPDYEEIE